MEQIVRRFGTPRDIDLFMQVCFDYVRDAEHHGLSDHWQDPHHTLEAKRGDCEDWAVFAWYVLERAGAEARVLCMFTEDDGHAVCLALDEEHAMTICNDGIRKVQRRPRRTGFSEVLATRAAERVFRNWTACSYVHDEALVELASGCIERPFDPRYSWITP